MKKSGAAIYYKVIETPIGCVLIAGSEVALHFASVRDDRDGLIADFKSAYDGIESPARPLLLETEKQVQEYVVGTRREFKLPLRLEGTDFQRNVWKAIASVPYGKTITYSELAGKVGNPKSYRAAANACGDNPIGLIIPCHRILRSGGALGGYSGGGIAKKRLLLDLENARAHTLRSAA